MKVKLVTFKKNNKRYTFESTDSVDVFISFGTILIVYLLNKDKKIRVKAFNSKINDIDEFYFSKE
jgi:hypothetical protein